MNRILSRMKRWGNRVDLEQDSSANSDLSNTEEALSRRKFLLAQGQLPVLLF